MSAGPPLRSLLTEFKREGVLDKVARSYVYFLRFTPATDVICIMMGDASPQARAHKGNHSEHYHGNLHRLASLLISLSRGPTTASINPVSDAFPTLHLPAEYSSFRRFCATVYHIFNVPDSLSGVAVFFGEGDRLEVR